MQDIEERSEAAEIADGIESVKGSVVEFDHIKAGIAAINAAHPKDAVPDLRMPTGMKLAIAGRAAWRDPRINLDKARQAAKAPVIALGRQIDAFAARLRAELQEGEDHYDALISVEKARKEAERAEMERIEAARIDAHRKRIADIAAVALRAVSLSSTEVEAKIALVARLEADASFEEFQAAAINSKAECLVKLQDLLLAARATEATALDALRTKARLEQLEREDAERRQREAAEKAEADAKAQAEAEAARVVAAVRQRQSTTANELVDEIRRVQRRAFSASAAGMLELVGLVEAIVIGTELGDFSGLARKARDDALADLHDMHGTVLQRETDKRVADTEALRVRDELAAARADSDRINLSAKAFTVDEVAAAFHVPVESMVGLDYASSSSAETMVTGAIAQALAESLDASLSKVGVIGSGDAPVMEAKGLQPIELPNEDAAFLEQLSYPDRPTPLETLLTNTRIALIDCRFALDQALELLEGWINVKCAKKHVAEHLARVEELRALGGLGVTVP